MVKNKHSFTNDTISDFLARIKNAYLARHKIVEVSYTKILEQIGKILEREKIIKEISVVSEEDRKKIVITLAYPHRKPALTDLKRISKPGLRIYVSKRHVPKVLGGFGFAILTTSQGVMSSKEAKKKQIGGEVICTIW